MKNLLSRTWSYIVEDPMGPILIIAIVLATVVAAVALSGCQHLPRAPITHNKPVEMQDGTIVQPGENFYKKEDGTFTALSEDPVTGEEYEVVTEYDEDKMRELISGAEQGASQLPVIGAIAGPVTAAAGVGIVAWMVMQNRRKRKKLGIKTDEK